MKQQQQILNMPDIKDFPQTEMRPKDSLLKDTSKGQSVKILRPKDSLLKDVSKGQSVKRCVQRTIS